MERKKAETKIIAVNYKGQNSEEEWIGHVKNPSIVAVYALICGNCGKQGFWGEMEKDGEAFIRHFSRRCPGRYQPPQKEIPCCPNPQCEAELDLMDLNDHLLMAGYSELTENNIPPQLCYSTSTGVIWMRGIWSFPDYFANRLE